MSSRDASKNQGIAEEIKSLGRQVLSLSCDVSSEAAVKELFKETAKTFPNRPIDVVVFNPTRMARGGVLNITGKEVEDSFKVTVLGCLYVAQAALPIFLNQKYGTVSIYVEALPILVLVCLDGMIFSSF